MKKTLKLFALLPLFCGLLLTTACNKDDDKKEQDVETVAKIIVMERGIARPTATVHMFKGNMGPGTSFFDPLFSHRQSVTGSDGTATFTLRDVFDLEIGGMETAFHFAVFIGNMGYYTSIAIKKGETKTAIINLP